MSGNIDSYDFNLSLNDEELGFLGVQGRDLKVKGAAVTSEGKKFDFESPLNKFQVIVQQTDESDTKILEFNKHAKKLEVNKFDVELGKITASEVVDNLSDEIRSIVQSAITKAYDDIW